MRIRTVAELREELDQLPDDMPIMVVHQQQWPLREIIGGIWVDKLAEDCRWINEDCDCPDDPNDCGCGDCAHCGGESTEEEVAYLVLNGHPYEGSPYGSRKAWSAI